MLEINQYSLVCEYWDTINVNLSKQWDIFWKINKTPQLFNPSEGQIRFSLFLSYLENILKWWSSLLIYLVYIYFYVPNKNNKKDTLTCPV